MSNLFSKPKLSSAGRGRNGFDMSQRHIFSASPGFLLPYYTDFANAGDKYKISPSAFVRTEAIKTAAMMSMKIHLEFFFVPFRQMYMFWNEFYNRVFDVHTSFGPSNPSSSSFDVLPHVVFSDYLSFDSKTSTSVPSSATSWFLDAGAGSSPRYTCNVDPFGVPYAFNAIRLSSLLGIPPFRLSQPNSNLRSLNLFKILAYHKVFYSFYNNSTWFTNDASMYNVDSYYNTQKVSSSVVNAVFGTIHYRPWRIDYFTNCFPTPTFSTSYANSLQFGFTPSPVDLNPEEYNVYSTSSASIAHPLSPFSNPQLTLRLDESSKAQISVQDIRSMFALDRLLRVTGSAGSHYDKQTLAHLGVKIPEGLNGECYRVGSHSFDLQIADVVATSSTTAEGVGSVIGDVAGKGFASGSNGMPTFNFTAPESGVLIGIFSIEPLADYKEYDYNNFLIDFYDFYHPEFDNVGMSPLYLSQLSGHTVDGALADPVYAWSYRYSNFKTKYNIVNESIFDTDKSIWQGNRQDFNLFGANSNSILKSRLFYINPQYCNNIFAMQFPTYSNSDVKVSSGSFSDDQLSTEAVYSHDNFIVDAMTKCYKTSIMSVHSLPKI